MARYHYLHFANFLLQSLHSLEKNAWVKPKELSVLGNDINFLTNFPPDQTDL